MDFEKLFFYFSPHSDVLFHLQLCLCPLWSGHHLKPEYQQIKPCGTITIVMIIMLINIIIITIIIVNIIIWSRHHPKPEYSRSSLAVSQN